MRHRVNTSRVNRNYRHLEAMLANLVASLFINEKVQTTSAKAKILRPFAEKLITLAKKPNAVVVQRQLKKVLTDPKAIEKLTKVITARYQDRTSGFVRIVPTGKFRSGDAGPVVQIELV
jgi:large subunit ribosomal protein L17